VALIVQSITVSSLQVTMESWNKTAKRNYPWHLYQQSKY